jgi:hypothetical protein
MHLEVLEPRYARAGLYELITADDCATRYESIAPQWQNKIVPTDVNHDNLISPLDVLLVINELNARGSRQLNEPAAEALALDVDGNGDLQPADALAIINELNDAGRDTAVAMAQLDVSIRLHDFDWKFATVESSSKKGHTVYFCTSYGEVLMLGKRQVGVDLVHRELHYPGRE